MSKRGVLARDSRDSIDSDYEGLLRLQMPSSPPPRSLKPIFSPKSPQSHSGRDYFERSHQGNISKIIYYSQ